MPKNDTLILFSKKKDLYVRIFIGSLSLAYFFLNFLLASSLLLEESCSEIALLFTIVSPHTTFVETFLLKVLLFRITFVPL